MPRYRISTIFICISALTPMFFRAEKCDADTIPLLNGLELKGEIGTTKEIGEIAGEFSPGGSIVIVDDGLRRTFVPSKQATAIIEENTSEDVFRIEQSVANSVDIIRGVGRPLQVSAFNINGRREIVLAGPDGPRRFIQGITKITPSYCVLETLTLSKFNVQWESRLSTSIISREIISSLILSQSDPNNPNDRMKVVQLFIEAERYRDAVTELEQLLDDFPDLTEKRALADLLRQSYARQILEEIQLRSDAGQVNQSAAMLEQFPSDGIAGDLLGRVLELQRSRAETVDQISKIKQRLNELAIIRKREPDLSADQQTDFDAIIEEINLELSTANLARLAGFYQFFDDASHSLDQKLAFAISGWLLGEADMSGNFQIALSLVKTRNQVRDYLRSASNAEREAILDRISHYEGADPLSVSKIILNIKPPLATAIEPDRSLPHNCFHFSSDGDRPFQYWIQLPPEYDPYRRYPCVVSLNGDRTPLEQIDWWAGEFNPEQSAQRLGQATRHGYIVISPMWRRENQWTYEYSPEEHAKVIDSLLDARRRFSIDTDRTFISGHSSGGDAAWDIALAHPDIWAGLIGIAATSGKYVNHYDSNAANTLAMYFVHGEYDHARMSSNKGDWNRYLRSAGYDVMIATYQGRGHEHFQEEIIRIFDWMNVHQRNPAPKSLAIRTMRPWDNYFWWVELGDFPNLTQVLPAEWPVPERSAASFTAAIDRDENRVIVSDCSASRVRFMLYPEVIDFSKPIEIRLKGERIRMSVSPSLETILEDSRRRADRQHPFWAAIDIP